MSAIVLEWLNIGFRWLHVIAGIMWIGDSFLFMWLDSHLEPSSKPREGDVVGELWMTHSGGFFEVVKRKSLQKNELPKNLYWFKWESYTTWITGFLLLLIVYHSSNASLLVDPAVSSITPLQAHLLSLGLLPVGFGIYHLLWMTPLAKNQGVFAAVWFAMLVGLAYGLTQVFSGRGAFLEVGAVMGTVMSANVFFVIIPGQRYMLRQTEAGQPVDTSYGYRAKGRSIQNHYMTLPVLFTMLSNHFPSTYSNKLAWLVLALLFVFGAGLKYLMNFRTRGNPAILIATVGAAAGVIGLTSPAGLPKDLLDKYRAQPKVSFATVQQITQNRCVTCHSRTPSSAMFPVAPQGIYFDRPEDLEAHAERMFMRATSTRTMPLGNLTGMTDGERDLVGAWVAQGADIHAAGGAVLPPPVPVADAGPTVALSPEAEAKNRFDTFCSTCHGVNGDGTGPAAAALNPKPRDFHDPKWQASVTDEDLGMVILGGGGAVGKSAAMPPNPDLAQKPDVVSELIKRIRSFKPQ
ncbi:MAG: urate hydroxylase PuuD [Myxococcaceae bacterium]